MKNTVKILALICALVMVFALAACGDSKEDTSKKSDDKTSDATEAPKDSNLTDFEWVKLEIPEGWYDAAESSAYVTVKDEADAYHIVKIFCDGKGADYSMEYIANLDVESDPDRYTADEPIEIGGRTYYPVRFKFNDEDSVRLFTEIDSEHYSYITVFQMSENDPAVQTILNSIEFVPENM